MRPLAGAHKGRALLNGIRVLIQEATPPHLPREDTNISLPPGRGPSPGLVPPSSQTCTLHDLWEMNLVVFFFFFFISHPVCGGWLQQPGRIRPSARVPQKCFSVQSDRYNTRRHKDHALQQAEPRSINTGSGAPAAWNSGYVGDPRMRPGRARCACASPDPPLFSSPSVFPVHAVFTFQDAIGGF